jgi:ornithine carbamoyltransferase
MRIAGVVWSHCVNGLCPARNADAPAQAGLIGINQTRGAADSLRTVHEVHLAKDDVWSHGLPGAVLDQARALQEAASRGATRALLRGKHLCLFCHDADQPAALLFRDAAHELGARVSSVAPSGLESDGVQPVAETARVLGRLYDAVECQGLTERLIEDLRAQAAIPVFAGIATPAHPSARLVARLEGPEHERRRFILQAMLIVSLS